MRRISVGESFNASVLTIFLTVLTVLCSSNVQEARYRQKLYVVESKDRMIEAIYPSANDAKEMIDCYLYGDRHIIQETLKNMTADNEVVVINESTMAQLIDFCVNAKYNKDFPVDSKLAFQYRHKTFAGIFIYPGTKWCGAGNVANDYDDLGPEVETDMCCRTHDHCNDSIEAYGSQYGLDNTSPVTKSHCSCDNNFQNCLKEANTRISNRIGRIFFNILCMECYREDHPKVECLEYEGSFPFRCCQKYEVDKEDDREWQFFDSIHYHPKNEYYGLREDEMEEQEWMEEYKPLKIKELNSRLERYL